MKRHHLKCSRRQMWPIRFWMRAMVEQLSKSHQRRRFLVAQERDWVVLVNFRKTTRLQCNKRSRRMVRSLRKEVKKEPWKRRKNKKSPKSIVS
jgi:Leu/Phe-tRNA-protein transferase